MQTHQMQSFQKVLADLQSENKQIRDNAEKQTDHVFNNDLNGATDGLCQIMGSCQDNSIRLMAHILTRKKLFLGENTGYNMLSQDNKKKLKFTLLQGFQNDPAAPIRNNIKSSITEIADIELEQNQWSELFPTLEAALKSANATVRGDSYLIFSELAQRNAIKSHQYGMLKNVFVSGMNDVDLGVRVKSFEAIVICCEILEENTEGNHNIINSCLKLLQDLANAKDEEKILEFLESLVDLVMISNGILHNHYEQFVQIVSQMCIQDTFSTNVRILAIEFLSNLAEEDNGVYRSSDAFISSCIQSALAMMVGFEEDDDWANKIDENSEDDDELLTEGQYAIDRMAQAFGSDRTIQTAVPLIWQFIRHQNYKFRVVGLLSISQMAEAIDNSHAKNFVECALQCLKDPHPRVVYSAIHCLGQMCEDFAPEIEEKFHREILSSLFEIFKSNCLTKIKAHSGAALVNFVENAEETILLPYLTEMFNTLYILMQNSERAVQEQLVTIVSSVTNNTPPSHHSMLEKFIPHLVNNYTNCKDKTTVLFKCKCMESLTFIGNQLGKDKFGAIAHQIMTTSLKELEFFRSASEEYFDFALQSWIRIAKTLKEDFAQYLPHVMPHFFKAAKEESDNHNSISSLLNANSDDSDSEYNPENALINEQESALCAFSTIPMDVGKPYLPYVQDTIQVIDEYLDYWGEENIRTYSACAYPSVFSVVCLAAANNQIPANEVMNCMQKFIEKLIVAFDSEADYAVKKNLIGSIIKIMETNNELGQAFLKNGNNMRELVEKAFSFINMSKEKSDRIDEKLKKPDNDQETVKRHEAIRDIETEVLYKVTEIFTTTFKLLGNEAAPFYKPYLENMLGALTKAETHLMHRKAYMLIIIDGVNNIPVMMQSYAEFLHQTFIKLLDFNDIEIRQSSIYGLGILCEKYPQTFQSKAQDLFNVGENIFNILRNSASEKDLNLRDNAAATCGRVISSCENVLNMKQYFPRWLAMLPLSADLEEVEFTTGLLLSALLSGDTKYTGSNLENVAPILNVVAQHLKLNKPSDNQIAQLSECMQKLKSMAPDVQGRVAGSMSDDAKKMTTRF